MQITLDLNKASIFDGKHYLNIHNIIQQTLHLQITKQGK